MMLRKSGFIIILLLFYLVGSVQADSWNIDRVGGIATDWFNSVKTVEDIAYCATGFGLVLMDVSDKENPVVLCRIETNGGGSGIEVRDTLLYFCDGYAGLKIFSIVEPTEPILIGECGVRNGADRVVLRDDYAYISCGRGMSIVDISDPFDPEQVGRIGGECDGIALLENYAYLGGGQIRIVDIEDPTNPELLNYSEYPFVGEMSICNEMLFGRLIFYSLENRLEPELIHRNDPYGETCHVLIDDILFLPIGIAELHARTISGFNIEDPTNPVRLVSCIRNTVTPVDIDFSDGYFYTSHGYDGFGIYDFRDWDNTAEVGTYVNYADYHNVAVQGNYAYAFDEFGRFVVISLEDPTQPVEVFEEVWNDFNFRTYEMPIAANGNYLYTYNRFNSEDEDGEDYDRRGLYTYSIENPEAPELIHELSIHYYHQFYDMKIAGDFLYGSTAQTGLVVVSLENPEAPELVDIFGDYRWNYKFDIEGDIAVTATELTPNEYSLVIWDISNPYDVHVIREFQTEGHFRDVAIVNDYVYATAVSNWELWIISIADIENPVIVDQVELTYHGRDIAENNGLLYISELSYGVEVFSLEDPEHPQLIGYYDTPGYSWNLAIQDDLLFLADGSNFGIYDVSRVQGLWFLDLSSESHVFDSTAVDSVSEWTLTLSNVSEREREISAITFDDASFSCLLEIPFSIPSLSDTSLAVLFTPLSDSLYFGTMTITSGEKALDVSLSGQGYLPDYVATDDVKPLEFGLASAFPNPFNSTINLRFTLPQRSQVRLSVYDLSGRKVARLWNRETPAGFYTINWQANAFPSGTYFAEIAADGNHARQKLILVR